MNSDPPLQAGASDDGFEVSSGQSSFVPFDIAEIRISMFADAYGKEPREVGLLRLLETIRTGRYAAQIQGVRNLCGRWKVSKDAADEEAFQAAKKKLPAFTISGTAENRLKLANHSGLIQVDLDSLGDGLVAVRDRMKADPYIAFGFVSPSGEGLKLGVRIDGKRHAESFAAAQLHFRAQYGLEIDPKCKDVLRLCFVSYDPEVWISQKAVVLPIAREISGTGPMELAPVAPAPIESPPVESAPAERILALPSGDVSISESAEQIFKAVAPTNTIFYRGGALAEVVTEKGAARLDLLRPEAFRSRVEQFGKLVAWRSGANGGKPVLKPCTMPRDCAAALMATTEARDLLPPITSVLRCPVLIEAASGNLTVLGSGYHPELGGLLIIEGRTPPRVPLAEAVSSLRWLIEEFRFQSKGDESRSLAAFITPALRMGGFLRRRIPIDMAEADQSQAGKGHRHEMVAALYNETAYLVTGRNGGVGSSDESFAQALISGRPFVTFDNIRGRVDSQHLESFLTAPGLFPARVPHRGEVLVDPSGVNLQMSSNGLQSTRDLANRASICRILKRLGFKYRDNLGEIRAGQAYYLGCVFSVITEWVAQGKPRSDDTRHDFREWLQILDWIVVNIFGCAPLMDDHEAAQERVSNPALSWLRSVAVAMDEEGRLGQRVAANEVVELCGSTGTEIPGLRSPDVEAAARQVGSLMGRLFRDETEISVDGFVVQRQVEIRQRPGGGPIEVKSYVFRKS